MTRTAYEHARRMDRLQLQGPYRHQPLRVMGYRFRTIDWLIEKLAQCATMRRTRVRCDALREFTETRRRDMKAAQPLIAGRLP